MRILASIALCAMASIAWAGDYDAAVKVYSLEVKDRIQNLELINVTAEKPVSDEAEALDRELAAILAETESLETSESE